MRDGKTAAIVDDAVTSKVLPRPAGAQTFPEASICPADNTKTTLFPGPRMVCFGPDDEFKLSRPKRVLRLVESAHRARHLGLGLSDTLASPVQRKKS